jgi:hypothetical protein
VGRWNESRRLGNVDQLAAMGSTSAVRRKLGNPPVADFQLSGLAHGISRQSTFAGPDGLIPIRCIHYSVEDLLIASGCCYGS